MLSYPRAQMQAQVLGRLEQGYTARALETLAGYPSRQTLYRWAKADPAFAARLAAARGWSRGVRREMALAAAAFDEGRAAAFLLRVRRGDPVRALVRTPGQPNRDVLNAWKRQRPDFARALAEAARFSAQVRDPAWPFDQDVADRIIVRVSRGEPLPQVMKAPAMPGRDALRRWRRRRPEFAGALKIAALMGHKQRMRGRSLCTPALVEKIAAHIRRGGSLHSAAMRPGVPHHVTLYGWMRTRPDFAREIYWARLERDDRMVDQAMEIAMRCTAPTAEADRQRMAAIRKRLGQVSGGRPRG